MKNKRIIFLIILLLCYLNGCTHNQGLTESQHIGLLIKNPSYFSIANFGDIGYRDKYVPVISNVNSASIMQKSKEAEFTIAAQAIYGDDLFIKEVKKYFIPALSQCGYNISILESDTYQAPSSRASPIVRIINNIITLGHYNTGSKDYQLQEVHQNLDLIFVINVDWGYNTFSTTFPIPASDILRPAVYIQASILDRQGNKIKTLNSFITAKHDASNSFNFATSASLLQHTQYAVTGILLYNQQALLSLAKQICANK